MRIGAWAQITHIFQVSAEPVVNALLPHHIWNDQFTSERFSGKPRQPLYVLLLRVYRLSQAQVIPYRWEYGGCKSWIGLAEEIAADGAAAVLTDAEYAQQVAEIREKVEEKLLPL